MFHFEGFSKLLDVLKLREAHDKHNY